MKQIKQITFCAFIISILTLFYMHHNDDELNQFSSLSREYDPIQQDNDEDEISIDYSNDYTSNIKLYGVEKIHTETPVVIDNQAYAKNEATPQKIVFNNVVNEISTNNRIAYNENSSVKEYGPNNNYQDASSTNNADNNPSTLYQSDEITTTSNNSLANEVDVIANTITSSTPPPPGGGGQDPMSVPIYDFYGLAFLTITSILFGVFSIKKMKVT